MVFKGLIAAASAVAVMATPSVAIAQSAPVAPVAPVAAVAPIGETVSGDSELFGRGKRRGGFIIPLAVLIAIILGILVLIDDKDDDLPVSP